MYDNVIKEQERSGIIESVERQNVSPGNIHYIPHRDVIREDKETSKLRIVYDASAKANRLGQSLNDCVETGPCLLPKIFDILVRLRANKIAITSDIQSAFLNVRIKEEDRDFLRFLWVDDINKPNPEIVAKRFTSVLFGMSCSPFLLLATIIHHMTKFKDINPLLIERFLRDLYVDDSITGGENKECFELYLLIKTLMKEGGFNIRKWSTNDKELLEKINNFELVYFEETPDDRTESKLLGVQ